jgi:DDB1- and CUL4-associated factor 11
MSETSDTSSVASEELEESHNERESVSDVLQEAVEAFENALFDESFDENESADSDQSEETDSAAQHQYNLRSRAQPRQQIRDRLLAILGQFGGYVSDSREPELSQDEDPQARDADIAAEQIGIEIAETTGYEYPNSPARSVSRMIFDRQRASNFGVVDQLHITHRQLPNKIFGRLPRYNQAIFCAKFSRDGTKFMTGSQDHHIRIFDTTDIHQWRLQRDVAAREIQWSVIDVDFSQDSRFVIYSSWSENIHLAGTSDFGIHFPLRLSNDAWNRVCFFSIRFSEDDTEILAGSSQHTLCIYNIERRTLDTVNSHDDDVNAVCWLDESGQMVVSGSDDCTVKIWDRRALGTHLPVGVMIGHRAGIASVASRNDSRYFISNGKDHSIKLWDIRKMKGPTARPPAQLRSRDYDYRDNYTPHFVSSQIRLREDCSLCSFRGHSVERTLIRCGFTPMHTTGSRYIYTGDSRGRVFLYDILTGKVASQLRAHRNVVRGVAYHPTEPVLVSTSWDGGAYAWEYSQVDSNDARVADIEHCILDEAGQAAMQRYIDDADDDEA